MRTTVRLDDDLLRQAKALAARTGRTLSAVIEDGLREALARHRRRQERPLVALPIFKGKGLRPASTLTTPSASSTSWTAAVILPDVNVLVYGCRFPRLRWRDPGA
jgi:hypothetical protein